MASEDKREKIAEFSMAQAKRYKEREEYGRSFPHFLVYAQLKRNRFLETLVEDFLTVVHAFSVQLENEGKSNKVAQVYEQAIDVLPDNTKLLTNYASVLFKAGRMEAAEKLLRKALSIDPNYLLARDRLENLASSLLERWHFPMLNDSERNNKYRRALENKVKNGCDTVLDIGTGTGLLSLYASKAGASRVYACEASEILAITAADVFRLNEEGSRVKLIPKLSMDLSQEDVPEPIKLLVTETFDAGLLGEHVLISLKHAWEHQLQCPGPGNPFAVPSSVIPASAQFFVAAISCKYIAKHHRSKKDKYGYLDTSNLDISSNLSSTDSEPYTSENLNSVPGGFTYLTQPKQLFSINFEDKREVFDLTKSGKTVNVKLPVVADGDCDAIAAWFKLNLDENESITTEPGQSTCWHQAIYPVYIKDTKVFRDVSEIEAEFVVHKHVQLSNVQISMTKQIEENGNGSTSRWSQKQTTHLILDSTSIAIVNDPRLEEIYQWVAYYATRDAGCENILDNTGDVPLLGLQFLHTSQASKLTLNINTGDRRKGRHILDYVTGVATANDIAVSRVSCITELPDQVPETEKFNLVLVSPVLTSGRLDQNLILSLQQILASLIPHSGLILPHKLQLWCQALDSDELCDFYHLRSNDPVSGLKIADHINVLSVTHLQEIQLKTVKKSELTEPVHIRDIELTKTDLSRQIVEQQVDIKHSGTVHGIAYWFVLDFGWGLQYSSLEGDTFSQGVVMCGEKAVVAGDKVLLSCQFEDGLLYFSVR